MPPPAPPAGRDNNSSNVNEFSPRIPHTLPGAARLSNFSGGKWETSVRNSRRGGEGVMGDRKDGPGLIEINADGDQARG